MSEFPTQSLLSLSAKSRKPFLPTASTALFSVPSPTYFPTSPLSLSSSTSPLPISLFSPNRSLTLHGPFTGSSKAASSPASGSSLTSAATMLSPTTNYSTTSSASSSTLLSSSPTSPGSTVTGATTPTPPPSNGMVFVPKPKSQIPWYLNYFNNPPGTLISLLGTLTLGWPLYLAFNASGRSYNRFACHYDPYGPIFTKRERIQIYISDAGILGMAFVLYRIGAAKGALWVIRNAVGDCEWVFGFDYLFAAYSSVLAAL
ncbi:unnamed protein product [Citrullus colocynthis]|uniref:Uncharacterized protein n=1 Tax=Citrullus colocynthis TaxID=252529 RepID=A0ABP0Y5C4_9ROSI